MPKKLMIVDDDSGVRRLLRRLVQAMGHSVVEAADGTEAVATVRQERPDLVLLDMHMPRLDGIATLDALLDRWPGLGVIMMTGDGDAARAKMALERGACDFVPKPFDVEYLKVSVEANLLARS